MLEKNMTLCIETPYYEVGLGGVQMEDTIEVTENSARYLDKTIVSYLRTFYREETKAILL